MLTRFPVVMTVCVAALSSSFGGLISEPAPPAALVAEKPERPPENPETAKKPEAAQPPRNAMENQKVELNRLLTELRRSPRSFIYLRSIGFAKTDEEFQNLIGTNNAIFKQTRIVRTDEKGNRQIPGWPGISLKEEYKPVKH